MPTHQLLLYSSVTIRYRTLGGLYRIQNVATRKSQVFILNTRVLYRKPRVYTLQYTNIYNRNYYFASRSKDGRRWVTARVLARRRFISERVPRNSRSLFGFVETKLRETDWDENMSRRVLEDWRANGIFETRFSYDSKTAEYYNVSSLANLCVVQS